MSYGSAYYATVVDVTIKFVSQQPKENLKSSAKDNEHDKEELNEPDYDGVKKYLDED
ncbi:MAG: hypothetical protein ACJ704_02130 [Nitrososphaeraceae archaeon]